MDAYYGEKLHHHHFRERKGQACNMCFLCGKLMELHDYFLLMNIFFR